MAAAALLLLALGITTTSLVVAQAGQDESCTDEGPAYGAIEGREERWKALFAKKEGGRRGKKGSKTSYRIDADTAVLIEALRRNDAPTAAAIEKDLKRYPMNIKQRRTLCQGLEHYANPDLGGSHGKKADPALRESLNAELSLCNLVYFDAIEYGEFLPKHDPGHVTLEARLLAGKVAGRAIAMYAGQNNTRFDKAAVRIMAKGVEGTCVPPYLRDCLYTYADLILGMKEIEMPADEIAAVVAKANKLPKGLANWKDQYSVNMQLPQIRRQNLWPTEDISWLPELEEQWHVIREELDEYIKFTDPVGMGNEKAWSEQASSSALEAEPSTWNAIELGGSGQWHSDICSTHFRKTCAMLKGRPEMDPKNFFWPPGTPTELMPPKRMGPQAGAPGLGVFIYQAMAGTWIRPHLGNHCRLVASMGLKLPKAGSIITVGGQPIQWEEGKWILFDDSWEHEVTNPSETESRFVM